MGTRLEAFPSEMLERKKEKKEVSRVRILGFDERKKGRGDATDCSWYLKSTTSFPGLTLAAPARAFESRKYSPG